jgi:hypothetical protein
MSARAKVLPISSSQAARHSSATSEWNTAMTCREYAADPKGARYLGSANV